MVGGARSVRRGSVRCFVLAACVLAARANAVQFQPLTDLQTGIGFTTLVTMGPEDPNPATSGDGCIYAVNGMLGAVHRICFDDAKHVTSDVVVIDLAGAANISFALGIAFDPNPRPATEMQLYIAWATSNTAPFTGRI